MTDRDNPKLAWWEEAKTRSLERKEAIKRQPQLAQPGDAFLVVTEGTLTEPAYFTELLTLLQLSSVRVKVKPGPTSDPRAVIEFAAKTAKEWALKAKRKQLSLHEPERFDHVWAVIDTDVAVRQGTWSALCAQAASLGVKLADSTPCFEFWLLLHLGFTVRTDLVDGDAAKAALKEALKLSDPESKKELLKAICALVLSWPSAVKHAESVRESHNASATPSPANPSTQVDLLVRAFNDTAPEHRRQL